MAHLVEGSNGHNEQQPHAGEEEAQVEGHAEGVERGVVVIVAPGVGREELYGTVEYCRRGNEQTEEGGVEGVDVVEMDDGCPKAHESSDHVDGQDNSEDGQEEEQMGIGEIVDEERDGTVGADGREHLALVCPADGLLVAGHLHPDAVDAVSGNGSNVGHDDAVALANEKRVDGQSVDHLGRMLHNERQLVAAYQEVESLGIVVGGGE